MDKKQKKKKFEEFLLKNQILIVDKSSASRRRLAKTMSELGGKMINIHMSSSLEEAKSICLEKQPQLVLSDYTLQGGSGFDLSEFYRNEGGEAGKSTTYILVTSNSSQSAVAKAAEEDVDAFIIKPYTVETLSQGIINAYIAKNFPPKYIQIIEAGKELLLQSDLEAALAKFEEAVPLSETPSLAYFYIGQTKKLLESLNEAEDKYKEGLKFNHIHYKCQIGLFNMFYQMEKFEEAYDVVINIAKYFPANPDRLQTIVRLAVMTENYSDMEYYYEIFTALDMRSDETIKYICAGLYVAGKYLFQIGDKEKALDYFKKITTSAEGKTLFLRSMIEVLVEQGLVVEAQKIMSRFDDDAKKHDDFFVAKFLMMSASNDPEDDFINEGINLFNRGIDNIVAYKVFLKGLVDKGFEDKYNEYLDKAVTAFPDYEKKFKKIGQKLKVSE